MLGGNYAIISLLLFFFGASNDLLDYVPTSVYWQSKHVQVTAAAMEAELADPTGPDVSGLIAQLGDADPMVRQKAENELTAMGTDIVPQLRAAVTNGDPAIADAASKTITRIGPLPTPRAIRRLMAIRALGEMGLPQEAAVLTEVLKSKRQFEADYAAEGLALLNHEHRLRGAAADADCAADVSSFPDDCATILQIRARTGHAMVMDPLAGLFATNPPGQQQQVIAQVYQQLIDLAETVGNVRLQAATVGLPGLTDQARPYMAISFRGEFDEKVVTAAMRACFHTYYVNGVPVYEGNYATFFMPSPGQLVAVLGSEDGPDHVPLMYIVGAMAGGQNTLKSSPVMTAALKQVDMTQPVWGVAKITPAYRKLAPMLEP
ncbi:MAG: HEAT repeat domain-containing protein, partial [Tepidisphaeraceae bacterium]